MLSILGPTYNPQLSCGRHLSGDRCGFRASMKYSVLFMMFLFTGPFTFAQKDFGFDFRATSRYVSDPNYATGVLGETYPHTYKNGDGMTLAAGWETIPATCAGVQTRDRTTSNDPGLRESTPTLQIRFLAVTNASFVSTCRPLETGRFRLRLEMRVTLS